MWISATSLRYRVKWASAPKRPISCNCPQQCGSAPGVPGDRLLLDEPLGVVVRPNGSVPLIQCNGRAPSANVANPLLTIPSSSWTSSCVLSLGSQWPFHLSEFLTISIGFTLRCVKVPQCWSLVAFPRQFITKFWEFRTIKIVNYCCFHWMGVAD